MQNIVAAAPCAAEPDDTATLNFPIVRINTNEVLPLLFILQPLATLHFQPHLFQCPISELSSEMKFILLFFWILSLIHGAVEDGARVFSLYNSRSKLAVVIDSIRLQLNALSELQSEHSNYLSSTISSSNIETIQSLVDFILLQRPGAGRFLQQQPNSQNSRSHIQPGSRRSLRICKYQNGSNFFHLILFYFCRYWSLFPLCTRTSIAPHTSFKTSHGKSSCVQPRTPFSCLASSAPTGTLDRQPTVI